MCFVPVLSDCGREDEFDCEEAVARLEECCPGVSTRTISCTYIAGGACVGPTFPTLSVEDSQCIVARSCEDLQSGVCARISTLRPGGVPGSAGSGGRVCL